MYSATGCTGQPPAARTAGCCAYASAHSGPPVTPPSSLFASSGSAKCSAERASCGGVSRMLPATR
eukprot:7701426-Pyramimonas_sp.AAC.1